MLPPGKKRPTNKKNKKQIKKQALLAKLYLVGCIVCRFVFSLYVLFFFILNKSLFIPVVDFFYLAQQFFAIIFLCGPQICSSMEGEQTNVSHSEASQQPSRIRFMC